VKDNVFRFKGFDVVQEEGVHKVGTDGVLLGAWFQRHDEHHILDIGTGTGVIALMAAQRTSAAVTAIDTDPNVVNLARKNFSRSPWAERLHIHQSRLQDFRPVRKFNHILSNPPFFTDSLLPADRARLRQRHAEELTFGEILEAIPLLLAPEGWFSLILPVIEGTRFMELSNARPGLGLTRWCRVHPRQGKPAHRLLLEYRLGLGAPAPAPETLFITDYEGLFTPAYRDLGKDFYLDF